MQTASVPLLRRWGIEEAGTAVIENWAPLDELPVLSRDNEWAREHALVDRLVFLYSGTLGFKHDPSLLLELARWARGHEAVVAVVSEGPGSDWLAREGADEQGLLLLPYQPYERLPGGLTSPHRLLPPPGPHPGALLGPAKRVAPLLARGALLRSV